MCCLPEADTRAAQYHFVAACSPSPVRAHPSLSFFLPTYSRVLHLSFVFSSPDVICIVKERVPGVDVLSVRLWPTRCQRLNWPDLHRGTNMGRGCGEDGEASRTVLNSAVVNVVTERAAVAVRLQRNCCWRVWHRAAGCEADCWWSVKCTAVEHCGPILNTNLSVTR